MAAYQLGAAVHCTWREERKEYLEPDGAFLLCASPDVLDPRRRVDLQLPSTFPQQELNRCKILLANARVLVELSSSKSSEVSTCLL